MPSRPQSVNATKVMPKMVDLYVQPPEEDGGMPITHYIVGYENESVDFPFGLFDNLSATLHGVLCLPVSCGDVPECRYDSSCCHLCVSSAFSGIS